MAFIPKEGYAETVAGPQGAAIPPSESSGRELEKLRYMDEVSTPKRPRASAGSHGLAIAVVVTAAILVVGAVAFYSVVIGSAHMVVTEVTMVPGACTGYQNSGSTLLYMFVLTNTGSRDATAALDFTADGQLVDTTWYNPVPAGQSVTLHHSVSTDLCHPTSGTVTVRSATPL